MQESRLFKVVYYLLDKGQTTASELAEKFEVSVRTIYRDIDALSGAGIPVYTETGRNGGIHLMNDFVLDKAVLSEEEKQEILTALQSVSTAQNGNNSQILQKLSAMFHMGSENWLEVDFSRWGNQGTDNEKFALLKSAVIHCRAVKIHYASSYETIRERVVQPLKLIYKAKAWYLKAFCTEKQGLRTFKLNRIVELELLNESFPPCNVLEQTGASEEAYHQITLRFPGEMAYRVYDEFDRTQVQRQPDGDLIVSANMPADGWLIGFLLSFGTQVDILSPAYLKEIIAEQAKLICEKYKS
ncbi:MAG: YafY family transcriptional regulator [Lachnospiraceae bacterium]|jgi:predicted DNA-binding transcriptional regulator YafY|nr:YafY family transcriptional regulator [Lachnospiraceae bacterium]